MNKGTHRGIEKNLYKLYTDISIYRYIKFPVDLVTFTEEILKTSFFVQ